MRLNGIFHSASLFLTTELFSYTVPLPRQLSLPALPLPAAFTLAVLWLASVLQGPQFLYGSLPHSAYLLQGIVVSQLNQYPSVCSQGPEIDSGFSYMHLNPHQLYSEDSIPTTAWKIKPSLALSPAARSELMSVRGKVWGLALVSSPESTSLIYYSFVRFWTPLQLTILSRREPVYQSLCQG